MNKSEKIWFEILIGILMGMIIGSFLLPKEVWAVEPVLQVDLGQTVIEDMTHPHGGEIEEAENFLSENHIVISEEIEQLTIKYGKEYGICPEILQAMIWVESNGIADIANSSGCKGLMQIKESSHRRRMERLGVTDLFDPESNVKVGTDYLAELTQTYDLPASLYLYNGNSKGCNKYIETGETSGYVNKILRISKALEQVHYR